MQIKLIQCVQGIGARPAHEFWSEYRCRSSSGLSLSDVGATFDASVAGDDQPPTDQRDQADDKQ